MVIGFKGSSLFDPRLSDALYQMGYDAAQLLIQRLQGKVKSRKRVTIRLVPELKIRESTIGNRAPDGGVEFAPVVRVSLADCKPEGGSILRSAK
jgi:hypothetical protein